MHVKRIISNSDRNDKVTVYCMCDLHIHPNILVIKKHLERFWFIFSGQQMPEAVQRVLKCVDESHGHIGLMILELEFSLFVLFFFFRVLFMCIFCISFYRYML